MVYSVL